VTIPPYSVGIPLYMLINTSSVKEEIETNCSKNAITFGGSIRLIATSSHRNIVSHTSTIQCISSLHRLVLGLPETALHPAAVHLDLTLAIDQHTPVDRKIQHLKTRNLDWLGGLLALLTADRNVP
jgi:hypothetical protein